MKKESRQKTLPEVLGDYARQDIARFHMPGHKGRGIPMAGLFAGWDVTELSHTDNLHAPDGPIRKTETGFARAYGARDCFLLVNGSTAGVLAMLLCLGERKRVLLGRDCHRSAVSGMALAGQEADYLYPEPNGMVTAAAVEEALTRRPADAVLLTSPDYYGRCADVAAIAAAAHRHGALLLVDAAHGAHFPFGALLPDLCMEQVDMLCTSAHKTLNAFTQAATLFASDRCPFDRAHIQRVLTLVQSSSPSYPLMVSLDWALHTAEGWDRHVRRMVRERKRLRAVNGIVVEDTADAPGVFAVDPTRLVLNVRARGISGKAAYADLEKKRVVAEMADADRLVLITTPGDPGDWYDRLYEAVCTLPYGWDMTARETAFSHPVQALSLREATLRESEALPLRKAAGRICAVAAGLYPPGVVMLFPGERIEEADVLALAEAAAQGYTVFGLEDGNIRVVR